MDSSLLALALSSAAIVPLVWSYTSQQQKYHPGPRPLPVIGNLFQIPRETPWKTYQEWSKIYGLLLYKQVFLITHLLLQVHVFILKLWEIIF
jgi:hypothetical protein